MSDKSSDNKGKNMDTANVKSEPGLGDIDSLLQDGDGDLESINSLSDEDLIGDLSVLDDAIADMDSGIEAASHLQENSDEDFDTLGDDDIPTLSESAIVVEGDMSQVKAPTVSTIVPNSEIPEEDFSESQVAALTDSDSALSTPEEVEDMSESSIRELVDENMGETIGGQELSPEDPVFNNSLFEDSTNAGEAPGNNAEEDRLDNVFSDIDELTAEASPESSDSFASSALEDMDISDNNKTEEATPQANTATSPDITASLAAGSIGGDLHAILSKRLDALVAETLNAINNELYNRLSLQIEQMIINSVDTALPPLMENMSKGLKTEIEKQVKSQLPGIVSNLIGQISIKEEET